MIKKLLTLLYLHFLDISISFPKYSISTFVLAFVGKIHNQEEPFNGKI